MNKKIKLKKFKKKENTQHKTGPTVAQAVGLPSKHVALSSNPCTTKKKPYYNSLIKRQIKNWQKEIYK
jgi:biotin synthase-related radical SAM superfamily protein